MRRWRRFLARAMGLVEIPVRDPSPLGTFTQVATGRSHTCALRAEGTIACWGPNLFGEVDAPDGLFTEVVAGQSHSCGLRTDGTVTCWGANWDGLTGRSRRCVHHNLGFARRYAFLWVADRRNRCLLGNKLVWRDGRSRGRVHCGDRWKAEFVWASCWREWLPVGAGIRPEPPTRQGTCWPRFLRVAVLTVVTLVG